MPKRILQKIQQIKTSYPKRGAGLNLKKNKNFQTAAQKQIDCQKFERILNKKKKRLQKQLSRFARKRKSLKGDYKALFPIFGRGKDEDSQELERYESRVSLEHQLELELQRVEAALQRIKKGTYGICVNCGQLISLERLKIYPEAEYCMKCHKQRSSF